MLLSQQCRLLVSKTRQGDAAVYWHLQPCQSIIRCDSSRVQVVLENCTEPGWSLEPLLGNPLGPLVTAALDEHANFRDTEYYALEMHVHMQLLASPLRVHSVEAADLVYVPLWASQLVMRLVGQGACKPNWTEPAVDALMADFWADAPALLPALGRKPHWMALSEIEWGFRRGCGEGWGVPLMCHPLARDIMFASPEALTEEHPEHGRKRFAGRRAVHRNSIAVPYLGRVHRLAMQPPPRAAGAGAAAKTRLASVCTAQFRGSHLRKSLMRTCKERPNVCAFAHYDFVPYAEIMEGLRSAWFCIQPSGDTPTRSALLDCLASGLAVPAVFDPALAAMLPFADVLNYTALLEHVPLDESSEGSAALNILAGVGLEERAAKLAAVERVAHVFSYAVHPQHLLVRLDRLSAVHPMDDALTMSLKAMLRHACGKAGRHRCRRAQLVTGGVAPL